VLAHLNFSQMFEDEVNDRKRYLARHIVVATTVDAKRAPPCRMISGSSSMPMPGHAASTAPRRIINPMPTTI